VRLRLGVFLGVALAGLALVGLIGRPTRDGPADGRLRRIGSFDLSQAAPRSVNLDYVGEIPLPDSAVSLAAGGPALYVSMAFGGLATFDLTDPRAPRLTDHLTGMPDPRSGNGRLILSVLAEPGRLLVCDRLQGLSIYDATDPLHPRPVWSRPFPGRSPDQPISVTRVEDFYYVACGGGGLRVLPIGFTLETESPNALDSVDYTRQSIFMPPHWLLVADTYDTGLQILDIADRARPRVVHYFRSMGFCDWVGVVGRRAVVLHRERGFTLINVEDPARPYLEAYHLRPPRGDYMVKCMEIWRDRYLLAGNRYNFIEVFDLAEPGRPRLDTRLTTPDEVNAMLLVGDLLFTAHWNRATVGVYRLSASGLAPAAP